MELTESSTLQNHKCRWGVILMNLGTPEAPTPSAFRAFLKEFLSDTRVVELPPLLWQPILNLFILPRRPKVVAKSYQEIWIDSEDGESGSPLMVITRKQQSALQQELRARMGENCPEITFAMTYGRPKLNQRVEEFHARGIERVFVLPLYPQYSATTTAPIFDQYARLIQHSRNIPEIWINKHYYARPDYINALSDSISRFRQENAVAQKLLFSFHGIPQRCVDLGDPYREHCEYTANAVAAHLKLNSEEWEISFQSRFGPSSWLQPYTVDVLRQWAEQGIKTVDIICPAFAADCLETLEEIAIQAKQTFVDAGGDDLRLIPCLNDQPQHISMLANIIEDAISC